MKKSLCTLVAFMLLGLSYAKAQLVTMYDLVLQTGATYIVPDKNISFDANTMTLTFDNQKVSLQRTTSNGANSIPSKDKYSEKYSGNGILEYKGISTSLRRTCLVWIKGSKKVVGFYDDCDPVNEYINKLIQKGF